jgi:hypothetical protein
MKSCQLSAVSFQPFPPSEVERFFYFPGGRPEGIKAES